MSPLARLIAARQTPLGRLCGAAVVLAFPDAPRLQAALREFRACYGMTDTTSAGLADLARALAAAHGIRELAVPDGPAIGVASFDGAESFVMHDGAHWWLQTPTGVRRCPPAYVVAIFEVA